MLFTKPPPFDSISAALIPSASPSRWSLLGTGTNILHTLLPYSHVTDLSILKCPAHLQSKDAFAALLEPSASKWIDNLVKYRGYSYLIEGLSEDAKLLHFCSRHPLSEETLRGLASKRLLSLHVDIRPYPPMSRRPVSPSLTSSTSLSKSSICCVPLRATRPWGTGFLLK